MHVMDHNLFSKTRRGEGRCDLVYVQRVNWCCVPDSFDGFSAYLFKHLVPCSSGSSPPAGNHAKIVASLRPFNHPYEN